MTLKHKLCRSQRICSAIFTSAVVLLSLYPNAPRAQQSGNDELLKRAISAAARGQCPADVMSALLRATCEQQMPKMGQLLAQRGAISSTEFMGTQITPMGTAEVYKVQFATGSMVWMISTGPDGKMVIFWSPGP